MGLRLLDVLTDVENCIVDCNLQQIEELIALEREIERHQMAFTPSFVILFSVSLMVYMLVMYAIGYLAQRRVRTVDDYVLAGRRLPISLTAITIIATWFGAESLMTTSDEVAQQGWRRAPERENGHGVGHCAAAVVRGCRIRLPGMGPARSRRIEQHARVLMTHGALRAAILGRPG